MNKWIAIYNDGTELQQFEEKERMFKDIQQENLSKFVVKDDKWNVGVDLKTGSFLLNGTILEVPNISNREEEYRLIYFRRVSVNIGTQTIDADKKFKTFIGFQITIDGKNHKVIINDTYNDTFEIKIEQ